ncbi:SPL family radical SAM protein [Paenibacillus xylaniclasticus]|uniref:SPL family radical SAM protein n=1 Tax=Paenibacillus xylaniclasticus TaxID=588083 RepID=UPI000FD742A9|nr:MULTISPECIES: radical SAM protein [Paenibacillus]GFN30270.1 radical SAM protein [Paenibacillus curdlanolyticus]
MTRIAYEYTKPKTLLNRGTGFLAGYSHTLNPYTGCTFGCSYCYVRQMPVSLFHGNEWGSWVNIKQQSAELLRRELVKAKSKGPVTIFMSSSTDPYQPIEYKEQVTRSLLEAMAEERPQFLLVQTRSPLVTRDIDLLLRFGKQIRVSITIETDREDIRKVFTPNAPPVYARVQALRELAEAGVPVQAAIAPLLPCTERFAELLRPIVSRICMDDYWMGDGSGGRRTQRLGIAALYKQLGLEEWYEPEAYRDVYHQFMRLYAEEELYISQRGFEP